MPRNKIIEGEGRGGAKRDGGGGVWLAEWDVGQISICYPEVVISLSWPKSN